MKKKIEVSGGTDMGQNPFAHLSAAGLPSAPHSPLPTDTSSSNPAPTPKHRGRVDILRTKAGRGGKTVTLVRGLKNIASAEKNDLLRKIQRSCGCGGTFKDGALEIQGDKREETAKILREAGFNPVFSGG